VSSTKQLFNRFRSCVIKLPTSEKRHSGGTDVAGIVKYLRASCERIGYRDKNRFSTKIDSRAQSATMMMTTTAITGNEAKENVAGAIAVPVKFKVAVRAADYFGFAQFFVNLATRSTDGTVGNERVTKCTLLWQSWNEYDVAHMTHTQYGYNILQAKKDVILY
ncbi:5306_t:CDS:2, partial [Ambispora gerdemannii]